MFSYIKMSVSPLSHCILADPKEPLVPPRFLERFSNRKVKQGTSITLSVKVEGLFTLLYFVKLPFMHAHNGAHLLYIIFLKNSQCNFLSQGLPLLWSLG